MSDGIVAARLAAKQARARLADDIALLQVRASPSALAADAALGAREAAAGVAGEAVEMVRTRPLAAVGAVAAVGLLFTARPLRRAATSAGAFAWRNRSAIGRLFVRSKAGQRRRDED